ncbi:MAG: hypothetical protein O7G85_03025 [Planctomycetota bacterium]|nr:hypothetical protein [Planctomycetota bacterium]
MPHDGNNSAVHGNTRCPRCGYDLRGAIETWKEACPLHGTCTECGLAFAWAELLSRHVRLALWCVEFAQDFGEYRRRFERTALKSFQPWRFWRELRLAHEPRIARLTLYGMLLIVVVWLLVMVGQGTLAGSFWYHQNFFPSGTPNTSGYAFVIRCMLLPSSETSLGFVSSPGWTSPLPAPSDFLLECLDDEWDIPIFLSVYSLIAPLVFLVLPVTMRMAKVRRVHVYRIFVYGLLFSTLALSLHILARVLPELQYRFIPTWISIVFDWLARISLVAFLPLMMIWWHVAIKTYLQMKGSFKIWLAITLIALLTALVAVYVWYPPRLVEILSWILFRSTT